MSRIKAKSHKASLGMLGVFLLVNILFNRSLWRDLLNSRNLENLPLSDATITEVLTETSYSNLLAGKNIFTRNEKLFYPYGMDYALNDPGTAYAIPFIFLRPFLSTYQAMLMVVLILMYAASVAMYALLRYLKVERNTSGLVALVYAYMPFISHRLQGHYTYLTHFIFPVMYMMMHYLFNAKTSSRKKIATAMGIGVMLAITLYSNFYYFIMVGIAVGFYAIWYSMKNWKYFWQRINTNFSYLLIIGVVSLTVIYPWIETVMSIVMFEGMNSVQGFGGAIYYSSDVVGYFTPNENNYFYSALITKLASYSKIMAKYEGFYSQNWDKFVYPGIILLSVYGWIVLQLKRKKIDKELWKKIRVPFVASLLFLVLSHGPFLKILGRWSIDLEGVVVVVPLPFLFLRGLPGMSGLRVPARLTVGFVFFAAIVTAQVISKILTKLARARVRKILVILFLVFLIDQHYFIPPIEQSPVPQEIYKYIENQEGTGTVLEVPLTVRDGLGYIGFVHALTPMQGMLVHDRPIMGGYFARVNKPVFEYYDRLKFVGYLLDITDRGNYNPLYQDPGEPVIYPFEENVENSKRELDFLEIEYIVLKNDEPYSKAAREIINEVGARVVMSDGSYTLYTREVSDVADGDRAVFDQGEDYLYLGRGFQDDGDGFRLTLGKRIQVFLNASEDIAYSNLIVESSADKPVSADVFINRERVGKINLGTEKKRYIFAVKNLLIEGVNSVHLIFAEDGTERVVKMYEVKLK